MAGYMSAAAAAPFEGVSGCAEPDCYGSDDAADRVEEFAVAPFGGFFAFADFTGVVVDDVDEVAGLVVVEPIKETHDLRVAAGSFTPLDVWRCLWLGLPSAHGLFFEVTVPLGCLFFLVLGACLR